MSEFWLIFGMMAVTFAVRYLPLVFVGRLTLPDSTIRALRYVPVAVLTAIAVPYVLIRDGELVLTLTNPYLLAGVAAVVVSWRTKNLLLTIVSGMAVFLLLQAVFSI